MDLHAIARPLIGAVNPFVSAGLLQSTGFTVQPNGGRTPTYSGCPFDAQVQALTYGDLQQIDGLNIQGVRRAVYAEGGIAGIIRVQQKGGDFIVFPPGTLREGDIWKVVHVLEQWRNWVKVVITLQDDTAAPPYS